MYKRPSVKKVIKNYSKDWGVSIILVKPFFVWFKNWYLSVFVYKFWPKNSNSIKESLTILRPLFSIAMGFEDHLHDLLVLWFLSFPCLAAHSSQSVSPVFVVLNRWGFSGNMHCRLAHSRRWYFIYRPLRKLSKLWRKRRSAKIQILTELHGVQIRAQLHKTPINLILD